VPELSNHEEVGGAVPHDYSSLDICVQVLQNRSKDLPSLDPLVLALFNHWRRSSYYSLYERRPPISSRIRALLDDMTDVRREDPFAKFVVFSKYSESLVSVKETLETLSRMQPEEFGRPFKCAIVEAGKDAKSKEFALRAFNEDPDCNVCLLHTASCGTGLTLTIASCLYMLEPEENAALEAQVMNRVHRIGQLKNVRCVVFFVKNSWEERLLFHRKSNSSLTEILAVRRLYISLSLSHSLTLSHSLFFSPPNFFPTSTS